MEVKTRMPNAKVLGEKQAIVASLTEKLLANKNLQVSFFLDRIAKMSNVSGSYLLARQMVLYAKA